jgi:hypothetical protein
MRERREQRFCRRLPERDEIDDMTKLRVSAVIVLLVFSAAAPARGQELRFSGFGDFVFGAVGGRNADPTAAKEFATFGAGADPVNTNRGFGVTGTDFVVLADMTEAVTFLGEINFQTGRGGSNEIEIDVERFFVNYQIDPRFNVQAGLFFTPIGYNNRFLYARAWLMNSIQVPDFFEEELNLFPTHSIGVATHGEFPLRNGHRLAYIVSASNGRAHTPDSAVYARDYSNNKEITGLVEWLVPGFRESRVGVSGWFGNIDTLRVGGLGEIVDAGSAQSLELSERGVDAYLIVNHRWFGINAEYVRANQHDRSGSRSGAYITQGGLIEVSARLAEGRLHPYVRFDRTTLPEDGGGPYLSLRQVEGGYTRVYVPEFKAAMTGAAFDVNQHVRVKAEYIRHLAGPRQRHGAAAQLAFGF